jgi:dTDP-4-amino-4,6-dideoxygalactose transaminase
MKRWLPPAAAPLTVGDLWQGVMGLFCAERARRRVVAEMKDYFGVRHLFFVSSGKAALTLILRGLATLSNRKQVVLPAYTCFSVPSAVVRAGLSIRLCDLAPDGFDYDPRLLDDAAGDATLCVVASHLFGRPADVEGIRRLCAPRGIYVVEDAAQAMGGVLGGSNGRKLGTIGDVGFFSLGRGKNITCGSGGVIVTDSDVVAAAIALQYNALPETGWAAGVAELIKLALMMLFIRPVLYGLPAKLSWLKLGETIFETDFPMRRLAGHNMGLLWNWKMRLEQSNAARTQTGLHYRALWGETSPPIAWLRFPLLLSDRAARDRFYAVARTLGVSRMYPTALHQIPQIQEQFQGLDYPRARDVAARLVTFPTHVGVERKDRDAIHGHFG